MLLWNSVDPQKSIPFWLPLCQFQRDLQSIKSNSMAAFFPTRVICHQSGLKSDSPAIGKNVIQHIQLMIVMAHHDFHHIWPFSKEHYVFRCVSGICRLLHRVLPIGIIPRCQMNCSCQRKILCLRLLATVLARRRRVTAVLLMGKTSSRWVYRLTPNLPCQSLLGGRKKKYLGPSFWLVKSRIMKWDPF